MVSIVRLRFGRGITLRNEGNSGMSNIGEVVGNDDGDDAGGLCSEHVSAMMVARRRDDKDDDAATWIAIIIHPGMGVHAVASACVNNQNILFYFVFYFHYFQSTPTGTGINIVFACTRRRNRG